MIEVRQEGKRVFIRGAGQDLHVLWRLLTNIVVYGFGKKIDIEQGDESLVIEKTDDSLPFDPYPLR
jgi:hypothetical protein